LTEVTKKSYNGGVTVLFVDIFAPFGWIGALRLRNGTMETLALF